MTVLTNLYIWTEHNKVTPTQTKRGKHARHVHSNRWQENELFVKASWKTWNISTQTNPEASNNSFRNKNRHETLSTCVTAWWCIFVGITLLCSNQRDHIENVTPCSKLKVCWISVWRWVATSHSLMHFPLCVAFWKHLDWFQLTSLNKHKYFQNTIQCWKRICKSDLQTHH